jgi:hypothetical protein
MSAVYANRLSLLPRLEKTIGCQFQGFVDITIRDTVEPTSVIATLIG